MKVLVTGATGWVGSRLVARLLSKGHRVAGTRGGSAPSHESRLTPDEQSQVEWRPVDLANALSIANAMAGEWDAVVHLAGVSGHAEAEKDPGHAWNVNAAGTARLCHALTARPESVRPLVVVVSSSDVYGEGGGRLNVETDPTAPRSTYAATKLGAELAAQGVGTSKGLRTIVVRPWPHTGTGQQDRLISRWISGIRKAKAEGRPAELVGDPETVRDYLDVSDVVTAYISLLDRGAPGQTYNIATGQGRSFGEIVAMISKQLECPASLAPDPSRAGGARYSVGDAGKLTQATGWSPRIPLERTLAEMVDAQED